MPTEPQQDRNVEGELLPCPFCGKPMEIFQDKDDFYFGSCSVCPFDTSHSWPNEKSLVQFLNSRPSQTPQNVEAGDAAKQAEIDYANRREEDTRSGDAVKGVVGEIEKLRTGELDSPAWRSLQNQRAAELLFSDRLRLALSARSPDQIIEVDEHGKCRVLGDDGHPIESPEMLHDFNATGDDARGGDGEFEKKLIHLIKYGNHYDMNQFLQKNLTAIIAAASNAERLKVAGGLLKAINDLVAGSLRDNKNLTAIEGDILTWTDRFLSPTPAQTPGDERQG